MDIRKHSATSQLIRLVLKHSSTGAPLTGLTEASAGLIIGTIANNEAATTRYRASSSEIETISTLGTYAAPSLNKCRFKEVDATNHQGLYEIQLADARFAVASARRLVVSLCGAANLLPVDYEIRLVSFDPDDAVRIGLAALPNAAAEASGGLATLDAAQGSGGAAPANVRKYGGTAGTFSGGRPEVNATHWGGTAVAAANVLIDGAITAAKIAASALNGKGDWNIGKTGYALSSAGAQAIWDALTSALTTVGSIGKWILDKLDVVVSTRAAQTDVDTLLARLTNARAGYLDNLNVGGPVASSAEATAIQNNTRVVIVVPEVIERPDAGTATYRVELFLYDTAGNMEAPDAAPTIALVNQAGTDRSSRLDSTTMASVSTGRYRAVYTADVGDALEQLVWAFTVVEGGATRVIGRQSLIVDTTAVDFTSADRTKLDGIFNKLPSKSFLGGTQNSDGDLQLNEATGGLADDAVSAGAVSAAAVTKVQNGLALEATAQSIHAKTTNLPTDPADQSLVIAATDAILARLGLPSGASVSADILSALTILSSGAHGNAALKVILDAIAAKTTNLPASPAATGAAMTLTSGERDATATALLDLANAVDGYTLRQILRLLGSAEAGDVEVNTGTGVVLIKKLGVPGTTRITATCDEDGNREVSSVNAA